MMTNYVNKSMVNAHALCDGLAWSYYLWLWLIPPSSIIFCRPSKIPNPTGRSSQHCFNQKNTQIDRLFKKYYRKLFLKKIQNGRTIQDVATHYIFCF
jgi:hypothetical protein